MGEFVMPSLGADMEAGTLVEWLKNPGDEVKRGDIIAVVDTQKGAIEIEVFEDGILTSYLADLGTKVPVGSPLALIRPQGEEAPVASEELADGPAFVEPAPATPPLPEEPEVRMPPEIAAAGRKRARVTPAARRLAEIEGIDPTSIGGTGPDGAVQLTDIEAAIRNEPQPAEPLPRQEAITGMRQAIAAAMARSKREIPHYYLSHTVDLENADRYVSANNVGRPPEERFLLGVLFVKAVAISACEYPEFNGHFEDDSFLPADKVHPGIAINLRGGGLVAPAIHDAAHLTLDGLMAAMRDLVGRVRAGRFRASELSDSTITISSLGDRGVDTLFGVIYPPQVAIVGFGSPKMIMRAVSETVGLVKSVTVTLSADHRVSDGHRGALFLRKIDNLLQTPEAL